MNGVNNVKVLIRSYGCYAIGQDNRGSDCATTVTLSLSHFVTAVVLPVMFTCCLCEFHGRKRTVNYYFDFFLRESFLGVTGAEDSCASQIKDSSEPKRPCASNNQC